MVAEWAGRSRGAALLAPVRLRFRTVASPGEAILRTFLSALSILTALCVLSARRRFGVATAFHVAFVMVTIGLSLVVATGLALLVVVLLAVLARPLWRSGGGTA